MSRANRLVMPGAQGGSDLPRLDASVVNLGARLLLELAVLAVLAWWGWQAGETRWSRLVLAAAAPLAAATVWGLFVAPRAPWRARDPARVGIELLVFGSAVAGLAVVGQRLAAGVLAGLVVVHLVLMWRFDQRGL